MVKIFFNEAVDLLLMHGVDLEPIVKKRGGPVSFSVAFSF